MPQYKLYYFDLKGRAEVIRMLFAIAGQKYEDVRFTLEKWPEYKAKAPFGQCPYLEVIDGENTLLLAQSAAITRYLAKKFGLAGKTDEESVIIDMYADQIGDISNDLAKYFKQTCPEKKKEFGEKLVNEILPVQLKYFEDRLIKSGSGFIAPSGLTWVDLLIFIIYDWIPQNEKCFSNFKHLSEHRRKVAEQPEIAKWLKIRPNTPM